MGDKIPLMNTEQSERLFNTERKGQSAIEYLMTYGWMLLVVAIVGGAIFATVQGQCTQSSSGFTGQDIQVADFGVSSNGLQVELRNAGADRINASAIVITNTDTGDSVSLARPSAADSGTANYDIGAQTDSGETTIDVGDTTVYNIPDLVETEGCNTFDLSVTYDQGNLEDQSVTGTLTDAMEFDL